ncbi:uncharacterized protein FIBRA_08378 [Fibroporia radiculosa]|uniref:DUF4203 domain-containing protein n=1 Tax=Fibroporia radiculosa TaxID=599839 RepID=J4H551_9APHY|nr:uncharacterized protein FIBRA_08378 [Fibroporia radiculosa]CCM06129.1 predicted protein [Fibroporia radiculosa]
MTLSGNDDSLSTLFSSTSYALAYTLPLILVSVLLTFAGAFLTLDRTRAFPSTRTSSSYDTLKPSPQFDVNVKVAQNSVGSFFLLEGGIGGLASGYVFGVHFATFLSLLIPEATTSAPLNSKSFLAVWVLSAGSVGFSVLALAISVMLHPSLLFRIVLTSILLPIGSIAAILPLSRYQHVFIRFSTSSMGAFGIVISVALLAGVAAWSDVWERLWTSSSADWGTSAEKGLSTLYCVLLLAGTACNWFLRHKFGDNPDEEWNAYLANYAANLPDVVDRAGRFAPLPSLWSRLFGSLSVSSTSRSNEFLRVGAATTPPMPFWRTVYRPSRQAVKFTLNTDQLLGSEGNNDIGYMKLVDPVANSMLLLQSQSHDTHLSNNSNTSLQITRDRSLVNPEIYEEDSGFCTSSLEKADAQAALDCFSDGATLTGSTDRAQRDTLLWSPAFLRNHSSISSDSFIHEWPLHKWIERHASPVPASPCRPVFAPVPATPSLLQAVDRLSAAQHAAYKPSPTLGAHLPNMPHLADNEADSRLRHWYTFWHDMKLQAKPTVLGS